MRELRLNGQGLTALPRAVFDHADTLELLDLSDNALQVGDRLGEGASGVIHRARWRGPGAVQEVAIKRFKGSVTSDGWPHSEMAASLAAGAHAALVPMHGAVQARANAPAALVMQALPPRLRPLAGPPSFASCTRDVYPGALTLSLRDMQALARGVASAMAQLDARRLVHGDLYAHNLLWDGTRPMLSDVGATSFLPPAQPDLHAATPSSMRWLRAAQAVRRRSR